LSNADPTPKATVLSNELIGKEYCSFDGRRRWELLFEGVRVVILDTGIERGNDCNLVGVDASDLHVKWAMGGELNSPDSYDGIVNVWVEGGRLWAGTWSGFAYELDHKTGDVLKRVFRK
jgi:hypothetical protein